MIGYYWSPGFRVAHTLFGPGAFAILRSSLPEDVGASLRFGPSLFSYFREL